MKKEMARLIAKTEITSGICLTKTSLVSDFDVEEIRETLEMFYNSPNYHNNRVGSILCSCFDQGRATFLFSRRLALKLFSNDMNIKENRKRVKKEKEVDLLSKETLNKIDSPLPPTLSYEDYKVIIGTMMSEGIVEKIRDHTGSKAALYTLKHPDILKAFDNKINKEISSAYREAQKEEAIKFYDEGRKTPKKSKKKETKVMVDEDGFKMEVLSKNEEYNKVMFGVRKQEHGKK